MRGTQKLFALLSILALLASLSLAQDPTKQNKKQTVALAAASNAVIGSGTAGQITKWAGISGSNTYVVGDSNIFEDKFGKVGIGTKTPTSQLTVQGMIETTLGGIKFPDGTIQTTSTAGALFAVAHDATLQGNGTAASPLGVAVPLNLSSSLGVAVFSVTNTGAGDAVHISSIKGSGVQAFGYNGLVGFGTAGHGVIGSSSAGDGVRGYSDAGDGVHGEGLTGVNGKGNNNPNNFWNGGDGLSGLGGTSNGSRGGIGVFAKGGISNSGPGGDGVFAFGGDSGAGDGGAALRVEGGTANGGGSLAAMASTP